jgi:hypothetical protein
MRLTPRQIQEVFRILGHVCDTSEKNKGRLLAWIGFGSIAMAAFKVGNPRAFRALGSRQFDPKEAFEVLNHLLGGKHVDWWFALLLTGGGLNVGEKESAREVMTNVGLIKVGQESEILNNLAQWYGGWADASPARLGQIHQKIEQVAQWN